MTPPTPSGSAGSACQTGTGIAPRNSRASAASPSSFEPGNVTTAIGGPSLMGSFDLDRERLDQRVREQVARHTLERGLGLGGIGVVELDVDQPADPSTGDREPERAERVTDRLALRVENAFFGTDQHGRLHKTTFGSER